MTPSAIETITVTTTAAATSDYKELSPTHYSREDELKGKAGFLAATYPHYLPTWDANEHYPPLEPFEHYEHGKDADTSFPELLPPGLATRVDLTPTIGSEISGVQLSTLSDAGKDQLARFVAERKVVAFRAQDFADLAIEDALDFGAYFGRHHVHPTSGAPAGFPAIHLVHRAAGDTAVADEFFATRTSSVAWHSDVSYEQQPPGTTFLYALDTPAGAGGDTLFADAAEAYRRLSPALQQRLHGLQATHSGHEQAQSSLARGSIVRRAPVCSVHPVVRTHPATGEKALYVNPQCKCFPRSVIFFFCLLVRLKQWPDKIQSLAKLSASKKKSRTPCSASCTATWPSAPTSTRASSGSRAPSSCGTTA